MKADGGHRGRALAYGGSVAATISYSLMIKK